jgi:hypothetical protein
MALCALLGVMAGRRRQREDSPPTKGKRARRAKPPPLVGTRYISLLEEHLGYLHDMPVHGNRRVCMDHLAVAHLVAFLNPGVKGLRSFEDLYEHPQVRKRYSVPRLPKSTVSDAQRVFDPELLQPLIESLVERAKIVPHDDRLSALTQKLLAVDGSFFAVAPRITWALYNQSETKGIRKGQIRLHTQFNVLKGIPECCVVTDGQVREGTVLRKYLDPGSLYTLDRGFQEYDLLSDILDAGSHFVVRLRTTMVADVLQNRKLTSKDEDAGVLADQDIVLGARSERHDLPPLRVVYVEYVAREGEIKQMPLVTSLMDAPAWMIALIYQHRWQVELFFRWLKCCANFHHFFSENETGMTLQVYAMMIVLLLIAVETGAKPSRYDVAIMSWAIQGTVPLAEARTVAERRRRERLRAAERQRAKQKKA